MFSSGKEGQGHKLLWDVVCCEWQLLHDQSFPECFENMMLANCTLIYNPGD